MKQNETKKGKKGLTYFSCIFCDYNTSHKQHFDRHLTTSKHLFRSDETKMKPKKGKKGNFCFCGEKFNSKTTLWRHKNSCKETDCNKKILEEENDKKYDLCNSNIMLQILKQNEEFKHLIIEQNKLIIDQNNKLIENTNNEKIINICNSNNNNKTFNLNVFLNETCKDAMNIMDFVESLKLQVSDLENIGKIGFVEGISNIIIKNLKDLDITQRPIHCSDSKREVMYVKDENILYNDTNEENENKKLKKAIKYIAHKNSKNIQLFKEKNPDCIYSDSKTSDQYNKIIIEALGGSNNEDNDNQNKIIKKIAKEVFIDKTTVII